VVASYFAPVRLVAVVGEDFDDQHLVPFTSRGVDIRGLEKVPGQTFRWGGEYSRDMNERTTLYTHLNVFADFAPRFIPPILIRNMFFLAISIQSCSATCCRNSRAREWWLVTP